MMAAPVIAPVVALMHPTRLFIGGKWVAPHAGKTIDVVTARDESVIATVAEATAPDMDLAVAAAKCAFDGHEWSSLSPVERGAALDRLSNALLMRRDQLIDAWIEQIGSLATVAPLVIDGGLFTLRYYADLARTYAFVAPQSPADGIGEAMVVLEPAGVAVLIAPWNNPFGIMIAKVAAALAAGCTVVMKPAPETPIEAYIVAEAAEAAGFPAGVINLVPGHRDAADHLVSNPAVDKVSLTGSTVAGKRVAQVCGARLARYTLELGGKSAAVVLADADVERTARTLVQTIIMSAGQVCATLSRVIVEDSVHDALVEAIGAQMALVRIGDPRDPDAQLGPLAMERQRARVEDYLRIGREEGAVLSHGGDRPDHLPRGWYVQPALFTGVTRDMRVAREEIFGPVLAVLRCCGEDEAVAIANDSDFGLFGAVFTANRDSALRVARAMRTGTISHNAFRFDPYLPFGGFKQSGVGREGGVEGMLAFTETKSILLDGPVAVR